MKNHQTTIGIVEKGIQENKKIKLLGPESLTAESKFAQLNVLESKTIAQTHEVGAFIYYTLEEHSQSSIIRYEKGLGRLEKVENNYYIDRLTALSQGKFGESPTNNQQIADFESDRDTFLVIGTSAPSNIYEALILPHSMVSSGGSGIQITPIEQNSLVGRLDGDIEALNLNEVAELLGNVSLNAIRLAPRNRPDSAETGTMYFDQDLNRLCYWDGTNWREI